MKAAQLIKFFKKSSSVFVLTSKTGKVIAANPAFYQAIQSKTNQPPSWSSIFPAPTARTLMMSIQSVYTTGKALPIELQIHRVPYQFSISLLDDCEDACLVITGHSAECTVERTTHAATTRNMRSMAELTNRIAHDINNVLSGALGFSSYLQTKFEKGSDIQKQLALIEASAVRGHEITKALLTFARRRNEKTGTFNLNKILTDIQSDLQEQRNITITLSQNNLPEELPGNEDKITTAFTHFVLNACEAAAKTAEPEVTIETDFRQLFFNEKYIFTQDCTDRKYAVITITDNGPGVYEKLRGRMLEPYVTTKELSDTNGLGLCVAHGIIDDHEGITYIEHLNPGTRVSVYIPLREFSKEEIEIARKGTTSSTLQGKETILAVDDEMIIRSMISDVLPRFGYKAVCAESGDEALSILREEKEGIDLILLDLNMPGLSGKETYEEIRLISSDIPVIIFSGYIAQDMQESLEQQGIKGFIHKPFKNMELLMQIRSVLDSKEQ